MTHLHENALKIAVSIMYANDGKGITGIESLKQLDWLKNISGDGIELYLTEAERRGFITIRDSKEHNTFTYRANKAKVNKEQDKYWN